VGNAVIDLGGGRRQKTDRVDHAVGVELFLKVGEPVSEETLAYTVHGNNETQVHTAKKRLARAITYSREPVSPLPLFYDFLEGLPPAQTGLLT